MKSIQRESNDFSSFLTANASLAVIVDQEYINSKENNILHLVKKHAEDTVRDNLKYGGLNIRYFSWGSVRLKKDFIAAITVSDCQKTWSFFESAEINSILLLAVTEVDCPRLPIDQALMIPLTTRGIDIAQMILDIKTQRILKWKSAALIYDESIEDETSYVIASLVHEHPKNRLSPISIFINKASNKKEEREMSIEQLLKKYTVFKYNKFVVFTSYADLVINAASKLKMFTSFNQWLFLLPARSDIKYNVYTLVQNISEGANVAFASNNTKDKCQESIFCTITELLTGFVKSLAKIISEESALYGQISDEEWEAIRLTKGERQREMLRFIRNYLITSSKCAGCSEWIFHSVSSWGSGYLAKKLGLNASQNFGLIKAAIWNSMFGFHIRDTIFPHVEHKFRNISVNILTHNNPPWQIISKNQDGTLDIPKSAGIVMEIIKELSLKLNFSYDIHEIPSIEVNQNDEENRLPGSITNIVPSNLPVMLDATNFLFVAVATTIKELENNNFNFTIPISVQQYSFLIRKPDEISRIYLFTAPFTTLVWVGLICSVIITAPILFVVNEHGALDSLKTKGLQKMKNCFWYIYGALLQQGGLYLPKADSGRLIIGIWWIAVIVLITTYCGNLVAFLTFPKFEKGLTNINEVLENSDVKTYGLRKDTFFEIYSKDSTREDFKKFVERATIYNDQISENVASVQDGQRVNIDWKTNLQMTIQNHFTKQKVCTFVLAPQSFLDEQIGLIMPRDSPYLDLFNEELKRLLQMGFIQRWHEKYLPPPDKCNLRSLSRQIVNHKVDLKDMQGCFALMFLGNIKAA
ncbi:ionotropic receptor 93a [Condylostylus longicornis]|uniref:ionotropic receptor 93a n=1 Tax=Condylostylus longicornis TaxID=2530218 RepID=UPI00244E16B9|nr:ionotropic receptor 93a [Condylostylus longicornis]